MAIGWQTYLCYLNRLAEDMEKVAHSLEDPASAVEMIEGKKKAPVE